MKLLKMAHVTARVILLGAVAAGIAAFAYAAFRAGSGNLAPWRIAVFFVLPLGLVGLAGFALMRSRAVQLIVAFNLAAVIGATYLAQIYLSFSDRALYWKHVSGAAKRLGGPLDMRSRVEIALDIKQRGIDAQAEGTFRGLPSTITVDGKEVVIATNRSNMTLALCNEYGPYVIEKTDEYGFNNPAGLWHHSPAQITAIGDSFTQGYCVPRTLTYVGRLRESWPLTISAGVARTGTLMQYYILREYVALVKPKIVVWFFFENDLYDLNSERQNPFLREYLAREAPIGVAALQPGIDRAIDSKWDEILKDFSSLKLGFWRQRAIEILLLKTLREKFRLGLRVDIVNVGDEDSSRAVLPLFEEITTRIKAEVESWGGQLFFVYLPSGSNFIPESAFSDVNDRGLVDSVRHKILTEMKARGIAYLDIRELFSKEPDSFSKYYFFPGSHFSFDGNKVVAAAVAESLRERFPDILDPDTARELRPETRAR